MNKKIKFFALFFVLILCASVFAACSQKGDAAKAGQAVKDAIEKSLAAPHYYISEYYKEDGSDAKSIAKFYRTKKVELLSDINTTTGEIHYNADGTLVNLRARTEKQVQGAGTQADKLIWEEYAVDGKVYTRDIEKKTISKNDMTAAEFILGESYKEYSIAYFLEDLQVLFENPEYLVYGETPYTKTGYVETITVSVKSEFNVFFKDKTGRESYFKNSETVKIETAYGRISNIICSRTQEIEGVGVNLSFLNTSTEIYELYIIYYGPKIILPDDLK